MLHVSSDLGETPLTPSVELEVITGFVEAYSLIHSRKEAIAVLRKLGGLLEARASTTAVTNIRAEPQEIAAAARHAEAFAWYRRVVPVMLARLE